jgi:hypothetical protein
VPGAKACVTGWDDIARRLRESEVLLQHTRCVIVVECYPGVNDAQVLAELAARLTPALALNPREALLPPDQIEALVAPFLGGDDPVFGYLSNLTLPQFFDPWK